MRVIRPVIASKAQSAFDMTFDKFNVKANVFGGLSGKIPAIELIAIDGMNGSFERHPNSPPLPAVHFKRFQISDAKLTVSTIGGNQHPALPKTVPLTLNSFVS